MLPGCIYRSHATRVVYTPPCYPGGIQPPCYPDGYSRSGTRVVFPLRYPGGIRLSCYPGGIRLPCYPGGICPVHHGGYMLPVHHGGYTLLGTPSPLLVLACSLHVTDPPVHRVADPWGSNKEKPVGGRRVLTLGSRECEECYTALRRVAGSLQRERMNDRIDVGTTPEQAGLGGISVGSGTHS